MSAYPLILIPGLGADSRVYAPQRVLPMGFRVLDWLPPESKNESLRHYAVRMAGQIAELRGGYIGGMSLGAMIALEAARNLDVRGVISIGGCSSFRQINSFFRAFLRFGAALPRRGVDSVLWFAPVAFRLFENLNPSQIQLMCGMLRSQPPEYLKWSCRAILEWEHQPGLNDAPVHAIHGESDEIIPIRKQHVEQIVPGGRHLISLSNPVQVNRFIANCLAPV